MFCFTNILMIKQIYYLNVAHFFWFSINLFFGLRMWKNFVKRTRRGEEKSKKGKEIIWGILCVILSIHVLFLFFSALSFPKLPNRIIPSPRRNRNKDITDAVAVEARSQMSNAQIINMSPQIEQRKAAVLGP